MRDKLQFMERHQRKEIPFIREICKDKSDEEMRSAEEVFRRYLSLVEGICERLEEEELSGHNDQDI